VLERQLSDVQSRVKEVQSCANQLRRAATHGVSESPGNLDTCIEALAQAESGLGQIVDELQALAQSYVDVFEASPAAFVVTTIDSDIIGLNHAAAVLLRAIPNAAVGSSLVDVLRQRLPGVSVPPNLGLPCIDRVCEVACGGNLNARIVPLPRRQYREPRWLWCLREDAPGPGQFLADSAAQSEMAIKHSPRDESVGFFRDALEHCAVGIVLVEGAAGDHVLLNRAARAVLGTSRASRHNLSECDSATYLPNGEAHAMTAFWSHQIRQGESIVGQMLLVRPKRDRERWIRLSGTPVRGSRGEISGALFILDDVTEIREEQQRRSEWLSMVVHDLRAPLAVIAGYAQLAEKQLAEEGSTELSALQPIKTNASRLTRMIADLLDASRIEISQLSIQRSQVDLVALVERVVGGLRQTVENRPIQVTRPDDRGSEVSADPERIAQVLENLLQNAVKYGSAGTPIIVELRWDLDFAWVAVMNQGEEIASEDSQALFRRFHRARSARQNGAPGLGLGLYIARGIVEAHGGTIGVNSAAGWTKFEFSLPIRVSSDEHG